MNTSLVEVLEPVDAACAPAQARISVADVVASYLLEAGITKVFGMPGGATIPLHTSIDNLSGLDFVLTAHEGGASYMADCFARVSGRPAACCATTGPGATNLLTGVASARQDSVPMIVLTGMNPTDTWGRGDFQECSPFWPLDTVQLFRSVCKLSECIVSEKTLLHRLRHAIATAVSGRPGPVHLAIPRDLWSREIRYEPLDLRTRLPRPPSPSESAVDLVAQHLITARRPVILFGSGASDQAAELLFRISDLSGVPIISTPRAKGKRYSSRSLYYLGGMGISGAPLVDAFLEDTDFDFVLTVGAGFGSYATNTWDETFLPASAGTLVQVNIDPDDIGRNYRADIGIVADALAFGESLLTKLNRITSSVDPARTAWAAGWAAKPRVQPTPPARPTTAGAHPLAIIAAVDQAVGSNGIVLADSSSILLWATQALPDKVGRRFVSVWGWASMGHVTAGAIGAKLADPGADVVALTGDGCFLMNGNEIATAVALALPVVWVINANAQLGMIHYELRATKKTACATTRSYNFAAYAESLGAIGVRCTDPYRLADEIKQGLRASRPTVIQVDVDPEPVPPMGSKKAGGARWRAYLEQL